MNEDFLHYIWKFGLFDTSRLISSCGKSLEIIKPGEHNKDSGPDFFNAQIKIENTIWAGNVEIHVHSSDWLKHKHQNDMAYNNVILHVVLVDDAQIKTINDEILPTLELKYLILPNVKHNYEQLKNSTQKLPCASQLSEIKSFTLSAWLERMAIERLEEKTIEIQKIFKSTTNNWEETFYLLLAKNFGFKTNADAFYQLAKKISYHLLLKHKNDLLQIESILFGTAGMLEEIFNESYPKNLQNEYEFLKNKYSLVPMKHESWKFMRMRPLNFPSLRIAQFAMLIHKSTHLFSSIIEESNLAALKAFFQSNCSSYWDTHYSFHSASPIKNKKMGASAIDIIIINTVVPMLFFYGKTKNEQLYITRAIDFLSAIGAENNSVVKEYTRFDLMPHNACDSQALIHLNKNYCKKIACLNCAIGNEILKK